MTTPTPEEIAKEYAKKNWSDYEDSNIAYDAALWGLRRGGGMEVCPEWESGKVAAPPAPPPEVQVDEEGSGFMDWYVPHGHAEMQDEQRDAFLAGIRRGREIERKDTATITQRLVWDQGRELAKLDAEISALKKELERQRGLRKSDYKIAKAELTAARRRISELEREIEMIHQDAAGASL